jgi:hypothetical protein
MSWEQEIQLVDGGKYLISPTRGMQEYPKDENEWAGILREASAGDVVGIFTLRNDEALGKLRLRRVEP